jgi:hypothetical protein
VTRAPDVSHARAIAGIVAILAAGYFAIGIRWALGWPLGWIDSGLVVYGSWRVADGALPYRDFDQSTAPRSSIYTARSCAPSARTSP